jgi:hydroxymethylpyrimidine/phosphomethylpyrimidine kinase
MGTYAMSLAGLDPSGGAGLLADIKTFEAHRVTGFGVCTALTVQTDDAFLTADWLPAPQIIAQALPLLKKFPVQFCKIGIVQHPGLLLEILPALRAARPGLQFVLDPVLKASAGYVFHAAAAEQWEQVMRELLLLTPNYEEAVVITGIPCGETAARQLAAHCAVLLKGGHRPGKEGWDTLYNGNEHTNFEPEASAQPIRPKHGSGCVLSAAVTASLALGRPIQAACAEGKAYTYGYLKSSEALLGYHSFQSSF